MRSIKSLKNYPAGLPLLSDDILELHAARLLLLLKFCGVKGKIMGLTKMAKLDFFVRYPKFFLEAVEALGGKVTSEVNAVESKMIRYHYGPWDERYYQILAYLEACELITVQKAGRAYEMKLTTKGDQAATYFADDSSFDALTEQMKQVESILGKLNGSELKNLVYRLFDKEIAQLKLNEVIE